MDACAAPGDRRGDGQHGRQDEAPAPQGSQERVEEAGAGHESVTPWAFNQPSTAPRISPSLSGVRAS